MADKETSDLETRVRALEQQLENVQRNRAITTSSIESSLDSQTLRVVIRETVRENYTAIKIAGASNEGGFSEARPLDGVLDSGEVVGVSLGFGEPGEVIKAQTGGVIPIQSGVDAAYGSNMVVGDELSVEGGKVIQKPEGGTAYFQALESIGTFDDVILCKFLTSAQGEANNMFIVRITSEFGGNYFGDLYENGPEEPSTQQDIFIKPVDGAANGIATGLYFLAWRGPNTSPDPTQTFFNYYIQPSRWM